MRFDGNNLSEVIMEHQAWLISCHKKGSRADFHGVVFQTGMDLGSVNLCEADFSCSIGTNINFSRSLLDGAIFVGARYLHSDFKGIHANGICCAKARFTDCDFSKMGAGNPDFFNCSFQHCYFTDANIYYACFEAATFENPVDPPYIPMKCPENGSFIGWKKCLIYKGHPKDILDPTFCFRIPTIVKLLIPDEAKRTSSTNGKCRCNKAIVLDIQSEDGKLRYPETFSNRDPSFVYRVGATIKPDKFDPNRFNECSNGIHFFMNRQQAVDYII